MSCSFPAPENPPWFSSPTLHSWLVLATPSNLSNVNGIWGFRLFQQLINRELKSHRADDTPRGSPMFISVSILIYFHSSFFLVYCLVALFTPGVSTCRQTIGETSSSALSCLNDEAFRHLLTFPTNFLCLSGVVQSLGVSTLQILGSFSHRHSFRPWQYLVLNRLFQITGLKYAIYSFI